MLVYLFGATSSPWCSNVALQRTAEENKQCCPPDVYNMIYNNVYVGDFLKSVSAEQETKSVMLDIIELYSRGGFKLTKWISNSQEVIEAVPVEERANNLKKLDLAQEDLPAGKALGISWCTVKMVSSSMLYFGTWILPEVDYSLLWLDVWSSFTSPTRHHESQNVTAKYVQAEYSLGWCSSRRQLSYLAKMTGKCTEAGKIWSS